MEKTGCLLIIIFLLMAFISNMENSNSKNSNSKNYTSKNYNLKKYKRLTYPKKIKVYWFHTKTCPYCVKMVNSWNALYNMYNSDPILNKKFDLVEIDVGINSYPDIVKKYDKRIKKNHSSSGVPSIVMITSSGKDFIYKGDRSTKHMNYWIQSISDK
jgi:glutaredoxin